MFRKVITWGTVEPPALHPDAVRQILKKRAKAVGLAVTGFQRISPHDFRSGFVTEAYRA